MLKHLIYFLATFLIISMFSLMVFADYDAHHWIEDGNTMFGVFHVKDLGSVPAESSSNKSVLDVWKEMMASGDFAVFQEMNGCIYFCYNLSGKTFHIDSSTSFPGFYKLSYSGYTDCFVFEPSADGYVYSDSFSLSGGFNFKYMLANSSGVFTSSVPSSNYIPSYTGNLVIVDDLGEGGSEPPSDGDGGILDWLKSFWRKLKSFFVPDEGYFSDWFQEIKNAAMKKLSPISETFDLFNQLGDGMKNTNSKDDGLYIDVPDNLYYRGFQGFRVDILKSVRPILGIVRNVFTMVCVIFTGIVCYRRIIVIFEQ